MGGNPADAARDADPFGEDEAERDLAEVVAEASIAAREERKAIGDLLERALGRVPEHRVVSDGMLVVTSNNEGVPFVLANPSAPISQDLQRIAGELLAASGVQRPVAAGRR